ncbi:MAG TPA: hypothetical protein VIM71_16030 [Lacunisphaera sp.]
MPLILCPLLIADQWLTPKIATASTSDILAYCQTGVTAQAPLRDDSSR